MFPKRAFTVTLLLCLSAVLLILGGCSEKDTPAADAEKSKIQVKTAVAQKESISTEISVSGQVAPQSEVMIIPKVPGKVLEVPVDVGREVKKGDVLLRIDSTELELNLEAARAGLKNAQLNRRQAELNYNNAKSNYERMKALYEAGAVAKAQLEQAELQMNLAQAALDQPVEETAQNQIDTILNQISNTVVTSPINGEISFVAVEAGELAGTTQPVMAVVNIAKVLIEANVAEKEIGFFKAGQKVTVEVGSLGKSFEGVVQAVSPAAARETKGYLVKVEIDNKDRLLKPGMFAAVKVVTASKSDVLAVPETALVSKDSNKVLFVVRDGKAEARQVETGLRSGGRVEIVSGLAEGEQYVIEGQNALSDGMEVTVKH